MNANKTFQSLFILLIFSFLSVPTAHAFGVVSSTSSEETESKSYSAGTSMSFSQVKLETDKGLSSKNELSTGSKLSTTSTLGVSSSADAVTEESDTSSQTSNSFYKSSLGSKTKASASKGSSFGNFGGLSTVGNSRRSVELGKASFGDS